MEHKKFEQDIERKFEVNTSFAKQVDAVLSGADTTSTHLKVMGTPLILRQLGAQNLPILMTARHLKNIVASSGNDTSVNYHNIDLDIIKKLPELIADPVMVMDSLTKPDSIVFIISAEDKENRPIIGAIKFDGHGNLNDIEIKSNILTSTYGKDNFNNFIKINVDRNTILYWNKEKSQELIKTPGLQLPNNLNSLTSNIIIRKANAFVNSLDEKNENIVGSIANNVEDRKLSELETKLSQDRLDELQKHFGDKSNDEETLKTQQEKKANSNEQIERSEVEEPKQYLSPQQYFAQKNLKRIEQIEANTPQEMKDLPNWCVYKTMYDRETGKTAKKILKASDGTWAKSNDPTTWSTFEQALQYARENNCAGLAFALNKKGITCIDIDHCINEQNYRSELCWDILNRSQGTYAEKSVSNRGVHIFFKADMVDGYRIKNDDIGLECYDSTRFISMTGNLIKNHKNELVEASDKLVTYVHEKMGKMQERKNDIEQRQGVSFLSDREVIEKIERSQVGSLFQRMWSGEKIVNNDHSATDLKLMNMLAFFTDCDRNQMLSIFSQSGLMRNEKPNKYYERTADKAISTLPQRADHLTASQKSKSKAQSQNKKTSQSNEQQSIKS